MHQRPQLPYIKSIYCVNNYTLCLIKLITRAKNNAWCAILAILNYKFFRLERRVKKAFSNNEIPMNEWLKFM
jgi:hypothetical protein